MKEYYKLPLGSIVKLKKVEDLIMIVGYISTYNNQNYVYSGVLYPSGFIDETRIIPFNPEHIDEILFLGSLNY